MKKTVLITGSGSGLGKEAAITLAKRGHNVIATTKYEKEADEINNYALSNNLPIKSFKLDILDNNDRNKILKHDFDILINNAAIGDSGSISEIQINRIKNVFETNIFANIQITQLAISKMIKSKKGRIVFLSSLAGRVSMPFLAPYSSSKFAIEGFSQALRYEMKFLDNANIEVGIIEPGAYATGFNKENNEKKYYWMKNNSYFSDKLIKIRKLENYFWNLIELKNFNSIMKQYVKVVECKKLKFRYTAPKFQSFFIQLLRIFGM